MNRDRIMIGFGILALGELVFVGCTTDLLGESTSESTFRDGGEHRNPPDPLAGGGAGGGSASGGAAGEGIGGSGAAGAPSGGAPSGGASTGGVATSTGGAPTGGAATSSGGTSTGGTGTSTGGSSSTCAPGTYNVGPDPGTCVKWSDCKAGEYIMNEGTSTGDRECAPCKVGSFSTVANSPVCTLWKTCLISEDQPGSSTSDRTCIKDEWVEQFGSLLEDSASSVAVDLTGNVYVGGSVAGALPGQPRADGAYNAYLRKYDSLGQEVWTREFGSQDSDTAESVAVDGPGNVYVAGSVGGPTGGALPGQTSAGATDVFVRRYDSAGNEVWTHQFGSSGYDTGWVSVDKSGYVYVSGLTQNGLPGQPPVERDAGTGAGALFVRKYDPSGVEVWTLQFGVSSARLLAGHASVDYSGNVYVCGVTDGTLPNQKNEGGDDAFLRVYNTDGTELWARQFGTSSTDSCNAVTADSLGNVYVVGDAFEALPNQTSASPGVADAFVRKYDITGNEVWTRQFGTNAVDAATSVVVGAGIVYVGGITGGTLPDQFSYGSMDAFVRQYDSNGKERTTRQFGTAFLEQGTSLALDESGILHLYVAGRTNGAFPGQINGNLGVFSDAFLAKLAP